MYLDIFLGVLRGPPRSIANLSMLFLLPAYDFTLAFNLWHILSMYGKMKLVKTRLVARNYTRPFPVNSPQ